MEPYNEDLFILPRDKKVVKANELIQESRFSLSLQQQKIILFLISQITPFDEDFKTYEFDIREFCKVCGMDYDNGGNYELLKEQIKKIADQSVWIMLEDGKTESLIRWIEKPRMERYNGIIQIRLDEDLKPYLLQLKKNFTQYEIIYTLNFKSKYTIRLYELLKSIHYNDLEPYERTFSLDDIRRMLGAEKYSKYSHFKARVLEPTIEEVNAYSDKQVSYEPLKTGHSVTAIKIRVESKDPADVAMITAEIDKNLNQNRQNQIMFVGMEW